MTSRYVAWRPVASRGVPLRPVTPRYIPLQVRELSDWAADMKPVESSDVLKTFLHLADLGNCVVEWGISKR